ncbi:MAG: hypothetical protein L3J62_04090 [Gammaproteobacteria bacterium]|nr:hypothetical protein [Gammaproteobacteria bacterium]MCF6229964.1 hypothetical protein [Gammaproteobacteria bacterium]
MPLTLRTLCTLSIALICTFPAYAESNLQNKIDNILQAHGGAEVWRDTTAVTYLADTFSQSRHALGVTQRDYQYPDKFNISIEYPGGDSEHRQLNGGQVWDHGEQGSLPFAKATQLQAMRMLLPKLLLENRLNAKDLGTRTDDEGVTHQGIEVTVDELRIIIDSNAETGFILATWGLMEVMGQSMQFVTFYDDYRVIDGRAVAFKEEHYAMGTYTGHTEIKEVIFADALPEVLFNPLKSSTVAGQ